MWRTLRRDPIIWTTVVVLIFVVLPYVLPILNDDQLLALSDYYADAVLAIVAIFAIQHSLRKIDHPEERRFWHLITAAFAFSLAVKVAYSLVAPASQRTTEFYLATDFLYLSFYAFLFLATTSNPHLKPRWSADNIPYRIESAGGIVFALGLLTYFVLIPGRLDTASYQTFVPSLFLFLVLDAFLLTRLLYLHRICETHRWRSIYGLFALTAALWTILDLVECLMYMDVLPYAPLGSPLDLPWFLPYVTIAVAARMRHHPFPAFEQKEAEETGKEREGFLGFRGPLLVYALTFPLIHFSFYSVGLLDSPSRPAREVCLLAFVLLLGGIAIVHHKILEAESKKAEEKLRQSQDRYRVLFEQSKDAIYITTLDGKFVDFNNAVLDQFGYSRDEMLQLNARELYAYPADRPRFQQKIEKYGSVKNHPIKLRKKDGIKIDCLLTATGRKDPAGKIIGYQGIIHDITERKRAYQAVRKSRQRYEALVNSVDGIVWEADAKTFQFTFVSQRAERILGYPLERWLNEPDFWPEHIHPEDRDWAVAYCLKATEEKRDHEFVYRMIAADERTVWLKDIVSVVVENDLPKKLRGIMLDITDRKQAEDALHQSEEQLRHAQKMEAIGELAGGVAHEFNNMLTAITGYTELALGSLPDDLPAGDELHNVREFANRAAALTRQLLVFSRRQPLEPVVLNLNSLVEKTSRMLTRTIGEDVELKIVANPALWNVRADPGEIEQVLMNLAINARDAMPEGGEMTIETANVILDGEYVDGHRGAKPGPHVMLAVSDTGRGMDEETRRRIFEPFFTTKEVGKGTGLGLSVLYGIVKHHEGNIWVYSEPGKGTTFKIYLPGADQGAEELAAAANREVKVPEGSEIILIVEDEEGVRAVVERVLQEQGYTVLSAARPEEAEQLYAQYESEIALLLTDVVLPGYDGRELYGRLAKKRPSLKVLYMSGYTDRVIEQSRLLHPGASFIEKPFTPAELARKLRKVLEE